jgi:hypothetical protein
MLTCFQTPVCHGRFPVVFDHPEIEQELIRVLSDLYDHVLTFCLSLTMDLDLSECVCCKPLGCRTTNLELKPVESA